MGLTGANGFPCCGKGAVDIVEIPNDFNHRRPHPRVAEEEGDREGEEELLHQEPPPRANVERHLGAVPDLEDNTDLEDSSYMTDAPDLEDNSDLIDVPEMGPGLYQVSKPEAAPCKDAWWKVTTLECTCEPKEQQCYTIETLHRYPEEVTSPKNFRRWRVGSNSSLQSVSEKEAAAPQHHSICVQTSKHLFWANKLIQASEHSLQQALSKPCKERNTEKNPSHPKQESKPKNTPCPDKTLQIPRAKSAGQVTTSQPIPSPDLSTSSLPPAIGLAELINFASSLAMASSDMELPSLEKMIRGPSQKSTAPSKQPVKPPAEPMQPKTPPNAKEPEKASAPEKQNFPSYLDFNKPGVKTATIEGEVKFLQSQATSSKLQEGTEEQKKAEDQEIPTHTEKKPRRLLTRDQGEEQSSRVQKERCQPHSAKMTQMEPPEAIATKTEQTTQRAREFKSPVVTHPAWSGPEARSQSVTDENLLPLTPRQLSAFQDIFKLFSCSPTGTVDMHSMKTALRNVGIQLGPQEMCEALRLADLDGDGIVSFKDFLGVLTDNHYLAQCIRQVRNRRVCDPRSLKTLFIEMLFKLLSHGFVPSKSAQEVMSYYFKKQRALQLSPGCRGRACCQGRQSRVQAGLNFFCQAARVSGLSNTELARSLHSLCKPSARSVGRGRGPEVRGWGPRERGLFRSHTVPATTSGLRGPTPSIVPSPSSSSRVPAQGARNPYSQMPKLAGRTRPESRTRGRIPGPDIRLPKPHQPGRSKLLPNLGPLSPGCVDESLEQIHLSKRALSPATLVQKQPFSPSPASLQKQAVKSLYK